MSDEIKNPTRIEQYLSKAAGEDTDLPDAPMTRIEQYLAKIAGEDVELPEETYTRIEEYLKTIAENGGGGGGDVTLLNNKDISANGVYKASDDSADGYKKVTVSVPNTYSAGDEGKVVSNGALVAQTAHAQVTSNGTVDTTLNNSVEVAVPVATFKLLNSGTYTNASRETMNIPVTYSGTPTMVAVILNTTPTSGVNKTIAWLNGLIQLPDSIFTDFGGSYNTLNHAQSSNNNYSFQHSTSCKLYADKIECKSYTGAYHPDVGTYDWYIWGVA